MTFIARMTTETGAPMPRWLYLASKPMHTIAIAVAVHAYVPRIGLLTAAWIVTALYVIVGLLVWWRPRRKVWLGPGSIAGDALYHLLPSLPAPVLLAPVTGWLAKVIITLALLVLWWQLENAGYGPMRAS